MKNLSVKNDGDCWSVLLTVTGTNGNAVRAKMKRSIGAIKGFHSLGAGQYLFSVDKSWIKSRTTILKDVLTAF